MSGENPKNATPSSSETPSDVQKLIDEIEALTTEADEHRDLFEKLFPAMWKVFNTNKRKFSVVSFHEKYSPQLGDVTLRTFRDWWKSEREKLGK